MRDKLKSAEYFEEYIKEEEYLIERFSNTLQNTSEEEIAKIKRLSSGIGRAKYEKLIALYSMGADLLIVKEFLADYIRSIPTLYKDQIGWGKLLGYPVILQMTSMAFLLEVDDETWNMICSIVEVSELSDGLLQRILFARENDVVNEPAPLLIPSIYDQLIIALNAPTTESQLSHIEMFLSKWYAKNKDMPWYETHKSRNNVYYGYWSFETGAVAKLLGIDDSKLRETAYYPYDMVHFEDVS